MSLKTDLEWIEELVEGFDHLGTGSNGAHAERERQKTAAIWKRVKERFEAVIPSDNAIEHCRYDMENWFGTTIPEGDVKFRELIENDVGLCMTLVQYYNDDDGQGHGLDTADRDNLTDALAQQIVGSHWPMNMDSDEYTNHFKAIWTMKCIALGWVSNIGEK
ncbi:hypothetical protein EVB91_203 [Rhizobium phage RHph_I1_18]|nr:hypothetical protein EVB91_203 [Rhizobium phage RHph_I1_18]